MSDGGSPELGERISGTIARLCDRLLELRNADGFWEGHLSSSALSTATAVSAMSSANDAADVERVRLGVAWLVANQNGNGGWGDTTDSPSNLATTLLCIAALTLARDGNQQAALATAWDFLQRGYGVERGGDGARSAIVAAIGREYGEDRTFAVPILMNCALAELVDWRDIPGLPFELAALPHSSYKALGLHVVSYALPALVAIGLLLHARNPSVGRFRRWIRRVTTPRVLEKLLRMQPVSGGFLEATPLTSFVAMGLIPLYGPEQPVAARCLGFLRQSQRSDGAWPIDTNLSVWVTTSAVTALKAAGRLSAIDGDGMARWISSVQQRERHRYTNADSGGWAWTQLSGGVPDADDTSGAILAMKALGRNDGVSDGVCWLLDLQNGDGGWPTFCRGWGKLPFDRSSPDLTAHALRAFVAAAGGRNAREVKRAIRHGLRYLGRTQNADGSWTPLWFGNQGAPEMANPVIGTARVLRALELLAPDDSSTARAVDYLVHAQNADGGWGGACGVRSTVEETALATTALTVWRRNQTVCDAAARGAAYLVEQDGGISGVAAPVGLYFAHLWYSEQLYPLIWSLEALGRFQDGG